MEEFVRQMLVETVVPLPPFDDSINVYFQMRRIFALRTGRRSVSNFEWVEIDLIAPIDNRERWCLEIHPLVFEGHLVEIGFDLLDMRLHRLVHETGLIIQNAYCSNGRALHVIEMRIFHHNHKFCRWPCHYLRLGRCNALPHRADDQRSD